MNQALLFIPTFFIIVSIFTSVASAQPDSTIGFIQAIKDGLITAEIHGGDSTIGIHVNLEKEEINSRNIRIDSGVTKIGFIINNEITTAGTGSLRTYTSKGTELALNSQLGTNNFNSEGFKITTINKCIIHIPQTSTNADTTIAGQLHIAVPGGFFGSNLGGMNGTITRGSICIEKVKTPKTDGMPYIIIYGNMTVKNL